MIMFWSRLTLMLAACLAGVVGHAADTASADEALKPHQILVMLHLPPPHFRPDANYTGRYSADIGHRARRRIAEDLAKAHGLKIVADWPMPVLGVDCYVMEPAAHSATDLVMQVLAKDPRVEWVQPVAVFHGLGKANSLSLLQPSERYWHMNAIHRVATGRDVLVAVVDSGIEDTHPDLVGRVALKENFVDGKSYVPEPHGTGVAGIIAAHAGIGGRMEGIAPDARLMALRACWEDRDLVALCSSFTLGKALNFAIQHNARVINLSLGGPTDRLLQRLLDAALERGIPVVSAIDSDRPDGGFPASHPGVIAVSSGEFRMTGKEVLVAPGRDIPTTAPGGHWRFVSGSSFAAAHVSGMMALIAGLEPSLKPAQLREKLVLNPIDSDIEMAGSIDTCATIRRATGVMPCLARK